ncbi:molybdopterin molybdotransferase MoeA [Marihabitans asiaticum]|uniref:Molybdopterin molybdenumtransferase n=1 Tax=Marihabitans asiaticum TaxID=415218 RepID=A0A560W824_9MICO|nr:gephyrin-like molybdotransferase Glp [Marihabitans asiaticum]TWD13758.1 molybdopterin molybdochelatase [Marihabitans asiaticum]
MPDPRELLTLEQYRDEVRSLLPGPTAGETVPLEPDLPALLGRVLAEDVRARGPVPAFANSAMDGYAVRWADLAGLPARLRVVGEVPAGSPADPAIGPGECVRIMTGAPVPTAADTVVPVELTDEGVDVVTIGSAPDRGTGAHVRAAGEDVAAGDVVAPAGTTLTAAVLGAVAAAGHAEVVVRARPVVAIASTGDELVAPGGDLGRGQIFESNGTQLAARAMQLGCVARRGPVVRDDGEAFVTALDALADGSDLVVLTGGVSVGAYDIAREVLSERAGGTFRHVRMQPGKPQGWARWRGTPVLALPGNPVSAAISFEVFGRAMIDALLARSPERPWRAVAGTSWRSPGGRRQLVPVALDTDDQGRLVATPTHRRGSASHMVTSLAGADGLAEVPEDATEVSAGDLLTIRRVR